MVHPRSRRLRRGLSLLLLTAGLAASGADESSLLHDMAWAPDSIANPGAEAPALWFPVPEQLLYTVHWGPFQVATATVTADWVRWSDGRLVLRLQYRTRSNRVISAIYPVDDTITSYIDPQTFLPLRFVKNMHEGKRHEQAITDFDHASRVARWRRKVRRYKDWTLPIAADTRDIPSLLYWLRQEGFPGSATNRYQVMADDKIYDLTLISRDLGETVRLPDGNEHPLVRIDPEASFEGLFVRSGKLTVWVTRGTACLMTRLDAIVPVARVRIHLAAVTPPPIANSPPIAPP